jgi:perosamine synthetase
VIEDAACALGAEYRGRKCGTMGEAGCFSFHPRKAITTGEGGMVVTDNDRVADCVRQMRNHGMVTTGGRARFQEAGFNYRMTDFQGALGAVQMGKLESIITRRRELAALYNNSLEGTAHLRCPSSTDEARHVFQSYVVLLQEGLDRDSIVASLAQEGIETTIGTYSLSEQPHFAGGRGHHPRSLAAYRHSLCLPLHTRMSNKDVQAVAERVAATTA